MCISPFFAPWPSPPISCGMAHRRCPTVRVLPSALVPRAPFFLSRLAFIGIRRDAFRIRGARGITTLPSRLVVRPSQHASDRETQFGKGAVPLGTLGRSHTFSRLNRSRTVQGRGGPLPRVRVAEVSFDWRHIPIPCPQFPLFFPASRLCGLTGGEARPNGIDPSLCF